MLSKRIYQHKTDNQSAVKQHSTDNTRHFDFTKTEVIDHADTDLKLKLIKLQHIIKEKPIINRQLNSQSEY